MSSKCIDDSLCVFLMYLILCEICRWPPPVYISTKLGTGVQCKIRCALMTINDCLCMQARKKVCIKRQNELSWITGFISLPASSSSGLQRINCELCTLPGLGHKRALPLYLKIKKNFCEIDKIHKRKTSSMLYLNVQHSLYIYILSYVIRP